MKEKNIALILIDFQYGFDDCEFWGGNRNNVDAEQNAARLVQLFRAKGRNVIHVKHCSTLPNSPLREGEPGNEIKVDVKPLSTERVFCKKVNSAFIGTGLLDYLNNKGISHLVFAGLTTDHCVSTSVRMAGNFGFNTTVVADACATFDKIGINGIKYTSELIHQTALASLLNEFASVRFTSDVLNDI